MHFAVVTFHCIRFETVTDIRCATKMGRNYFVPPWACETPEINSNSHITEPIVKTFLSLPRE